MATANKDGAVTKKRKAPSSGEGGDNKKKSSGKKYEGKGKGKFSGKKFKKVAKKFVPPSTKKEKRALKKQRAEIKPHYETTAKANEVWGLLNSDMDKEERHKKLSEILDSVLSSIDKVYSQPGVARSVQKMLKLGKEDQKKQIFEALKGGLAALSLDKHGHFIVLALLRCNSEDIRKAVLEELIPQTVKLTLHNCSASVMDYMYASGKPKEQRRIISAFYGAEFNLFSSEHTPDDWDLATIFEKNPEQRDVIMKNIARHVGKASTKNLFMFRPVHGLINAYVRHCSAVSKEQMLAQLAAHALPLHHSAEGAWLVCQCLSYGTNKVRKTVLKGLKGRVAEMAKHPDAHMILIRGLDVIDDTVLLKSTILNELQEVAGELLTDPCGHKVLAFIAAPPAPGSFTPSEQELLQPALKDGHSTSKKPQESRRADVLAKSLSWLLAACSSEMAELIDHNYGSKVLLATLCSSHEVTHPSYAEAANDVDPKTLKVLQSLRGTCEATMEALAASFKDAEAGGELFEAAKVHYLLKSFLKRCKPDCSFFAKSLFVAIEGHVGTLAKSNRGAFTINALMEFADDETKAQCKKALKKHVPALKKVDKAGTKVLVKQLLS